MMKGQAISLDAMVAMAIFGIVIASVLQADNNMSGAVRDANEFRQLHQRAIEISDQLVLTRGNPDSWQSSSKINAIGLAYSEHKLLDAKLLKLVEIGKSGTDDEWLRGNLSTGAGRVYVQLLQGSSNCAIGGTNIVAGAAPSNARETIIIDRPVVVQDGRVCILRLTLWRPRS